MKLYLGRYQKRIQDNKDNSHKLRRR